MEINAISGVSRVSGSAAPEVQVTVNQNVPKNEVVETESIVAVEQASGQWEAGQEEQQGIYEEKEPTVSSIDSAVSSANSKLSKTRCEYSYDEATRRVSIKVFDKDSDELIREVPPEKSLEMLQKMWELAGIMVDEKR
ncbi:MAG: flagellar protein FlaG [Eubacteriales bacterium]|nr:flagellar protein FlaG [Eubacteriales bacterium]